MDANFDVNGTEIVAGYFVDKRKQLASCMFQHQNWSRSRFYMVTVVGGAIAGLGLAGNLVILLIFGNRRPNSPNHVYISVLAIADICVLITSIMVYCVEHTIEYFRDLSMYHTWLTYIQPAYGFGHTAQTVSVYITALGNLERFFAISKNVERRKQHPVRTVGGAVIFCALVITFSVCFNFPKYLEISVVRNANCSNFSAYTLTPSWLAVHPMYQKLYGLWANAIVMVFFPFVSLLVLNLLTIQRTHNVISTQEGIQKRKRLLSIDERGRLSVFGRDLHLNRAAKEATVVFIFIVSTFLFCNLWGFVLTLTEHIIGVRELRQRHPRFHSFSRETVNLLGIVNSSAMFVIYVMISHEFRNALRKNFRRHAYRFRNQVIRNRATNPEIMIDEVPDYGASAHSRHSFADILKESFSYLSLETIV